MAAEKKPMKEIIIATSKEEEAGGVDEFEAIFLKDLPKERLNLVSRDIYLYNYQGFWVPDLFIRGVVYAQKSFVARDDDIILASCPKSGTTWLKTLAFSIVHRTQFALTDSPLLKAHAHDIVPFLEDRDFWIKYNQSPNNSEAIIPQPRLLSSHISYESLPPSVKTSSCKIVYIARNPMDQFISDWHFLAKFNGDEDAKPDFLQDYFDSYCRGIHGYGPFWDHVLGFWKESVERPKKVLFLKYEDLKADPVMNIKRLAEFLGFPFTGEEEKKGLIEEILAFCSIGRIRNLEVNKSGNSPNGVPHSALFRKGQVGDSKNFLTPAMVEKMEKLMSEKYGDHNLTFKSSV